MTDELPRIIELPVATFGDRFPRSFSEWPRHTADAVRVQLHSFNMRLKANGVKGWHYKIKDATTSRRVGNQDFAYVEAEKAWANE